MAAVRSFCSADGMMVMRVMVMRMMMNDDACGVGYMCWFLTVWTIITLSNTHTRISCLLTKSCVCVCVCVCVRHSACVERRRMCLLVFRMMVIIICRFLEDISL